ncbi:MAG: class I SAM-dependent methyltransferase [Acidobacteria bacterium]|nr:class I SAM-dependent methyltransferase [Acidobacteriota bacterium]
MSDRIRAEFNQWALDGRSAQLEAHHHAFVQQMIEKMRIQPRERILEIGCGEGWASRMLAKLVPQGMVAGLDAADEMIHNARLQSTAFENLMFIWGEVEAIPWQEKFFTRVVCVESFYYFENPEQALREIYRVLAPEGSVWILNHISKENELSLRWVAELNVPVRVMSAEEHGALFEQVGFSDFQHEMLPDLSPPPLSSKTFPNPAELQRFRETGALMMHATRK